MQISFLGYLNFTRNRVQKSSLINEYTETLSKESDYFNCLMENAFSTDIRKAFFGSAGLAKEVGVKRSEIIDSEQKIDDYFLSDTDSVSPLSDVTFDPGANALDEETHTARKGHKKSVMNIFNRHKENYYAIVCSEDDEFSFITHAADILSKHGYQIFWHIAAGTKMQYVRCFEDELSDVEKCLSLIPEVSILHKPLSKFSVRRFLK